MRGAPGFSVIEPLERRLMLSAAGVTITSAQPSAWNVYASTTIDCNFNFRWWQGTAGGGTTKTLVVGFHDLSGHWVSGTTPLALMQKNPSTNSPGDGWSTGFTNLAVPATPGSYLVVAAEEPAADDATAEADFTSGLEIALATVGTLTTTACSPGLTVSDVSQTSWTTTISSTISGSFTAHVWNGTAAPTTPRLWWWAFATARVIGPPEPNRRCWPAWCRRSDRRARTMPFPSAD